MFGRVSHQAIADRLGVTRQQVGKYVAKGMPTSSVESALSWYECNTAYRRRKHSPTRCPAPLLSFDDRGGGEEEPLSLDDYPSEFWGDDACASIAQTLRGDQTKPATTVEAVCIFNCIEAAMRRHLCEMPARMAGRVGARDVQDAEDALSQWVELFCARWFGNDFRELPMLTKDARTLADFYRPLK